jgi:hypothetical protein
MKKILKRLATAVTVLVVLFGVMAPRAFAANGEYSKPECDGLFQDLTCTSLDHIAAFMTSAYEIFVDGWLEIDPATFDYVTFLKRLYVFAEKSQISIRTARNVHHVFEELVAQTILPRIEAGAAIQMSLEYSSEEGNVFMRLQYGGASFNPLQQCDDLSRLLIEAASDSREYRFENEQNCIKIQVK